MPLFPKIFNTACNVLKSLIIRKAPSCKIMNNLALNSEEEIKDYIFWLRLEYTFYYRDPKQNSYFSLSFTHI